MARRGSNKELSVRHEGYIARAYGGRRSESSGAADTDKGDCRVRDEESMIECKCTGKPGEKPKKTRITNELEKIADEAWSEGKDPALALRYWNPESPLAGPKGWVDLVVRLVSDDVGRTHGNET